ncbi:MAG: hypothetical protein IJQ28_05865, partial [Clostridia bacterium]|nr:hypothetical protein [Clostridia bacterium]
MWDGGALINLADSNAVNYAVLYIPYNSFKEYTGTFNGASGTVEYKGLNSQPQKSTANWVLNGKTTVDQTVAELVSDDKALIPAYFGTGTFGLANRDGDTLEGIANIHNAGMYVIYERVLNWTWDEATQTNIPSYTYNRYNVIIEQAKMDIDRAQDSVSVDGTKARNHAYYAFAQGVNGEQVYGEFAFASDPRTPDNNIISKGELWNNKEGEVVNATNKIIRDIKWEYNIYEYDDAFTTSEEALKLSDGKIVDGKRNMNNYLCQNDGANVTWYTNTTATAGLNSVGLVADQNSFYSGDNGVLIYSQEGRIAERKALAMTATAYYEKDQKITEGGLAADNAKTAWADLDNASVLADGTSELTGVFAEDLGVSAAIDNTGANAIGWRVKTGDAVSGVTGFCDKVQTFADLPEGFNADGTYYDLLVAADKYKGDLYYVTIKNAEGTVVKTLTFNDTADATNSILPASWTAANLYDGLSVGKYTVEIQYIGLYYSTESSIEARAADWNGNEEFIWAIDSMSFTYNVEPRNVALKSISDLHKIYDSTNLLVKDTLTSGDVASADAYKIALRNSISETQFDKLAANVLYNYLQPEDLVSGYNTEIILELAGNYDNADANVAKAVTLSAKRIAEGADHSNYKLLDTISNASAFSGTVNVAQMYVTHNPYGTILEHAHTPMRDVLGVNVKAFMPTDRTMAYGEDGYLAESVSFVETELVSKDDVTFTTGVYPDNNATEYDFDLTFNLIANSLSRNLIYIAGQHESGLRIDDETGAVVDVALTSSNSSGPSQFPSMTFKVQTFGNYVVMLQEEDTTQYPASQYGECTVTGTNGPRLATYATTAVNATGEAENEYVLHTLRYRITSNDNRYDVVLPQKKILGSSYDSAFPNEGAPSDYADGSEYKFVPIIENGDELVFRFSVPQQLLLKDVAIVAIPDSKPSQTGTGMPDLATLRTVVENKTVEGEYIYLGSYANDDVNAGLGLQFISASALGGGTLSVFPSDANANLYYGGATYTFKLTTADSNYVKVGGVGPNYNIVLVPIYNDDLSFDGALLDDNYKANVTVEKSYADPTSDLLTDTAANKTVYVNYKTAYDTNNGGQVKLSYGTGVAEKNIVLPLSGATAGNYNSISVPSASYTTFFDETTLNVGTAVTVTIDVWRDGMVAGNQAADTSDPDAHDSVTFVWTVSADDAKKLYPPAVVTATATDAVNAVVTVTPAITLDGQEVLVNLKDNTANTETIALDATELDDVEATNNGLNANNAA